jgi:endonuclease G
MRSWARAYDSVYVVTGPLYLEQRGSIGPNAVRIPSHYFKAVLTAAANKRKAIAFVLPNASSKASLSSFALPVDRLEGYLGRDLFAFLPNGEEQALESTLCIPCWSWTATKGSSAPRTKGTTAAVQCQGTTQKEPAASGARRMLRGFVGSMNSFALWYRPKGQSLFRPGIPSL